LDIVFRVDASVSIGVGHFMRCLALADSFSKWGCKISFICRQLPDYLSLVLEDRLYNLVKLVEEESNWTIDNLPHSSWLGTSQDLDVKATIAAIGGHCDVLIIDHYGIDSKWEIAIRQWAACILVIDDLADRHHECDILLDPNLYTNPKSRYRDLVSENCVLLLGPQYAILRDEFSRVRQDVHIKDGVVKRILVLMGGVDCHNITEKVINSVFMLNSNIDVDVVVGREHPALESLGELCSKYKYNFHVQPDNLAMLMSMADLAFGSSGSTSWERCCLGLPTVCLTQAFNQIEIAEGLAKSGAIINLGDGISIQTTEIFSALEKLISEPEKVRDMSQKCLEIVDGLGIQKIFAELVKIKPHGYIDFNN